MLLLKPNCCSFLNDFGVLLFLFLLVALFPLVVSLSRKFIAFLVQERGEREGRQDILGNFREYIVS